MPAFGLDIGTHSIKVVELSRDGGGWHFVSAGIAQAPPKGMQSENEQDLLSVSQVIRKLYTDARISTPNAVLSLPESQVFTRMVKFPAMTDREVASAIHWEAEQYIPIALEEAVIDYQIIGRRQDGGNSVDVLLVAAPKFLVEKYISVAKNAGIRPTAIETELIALSRSVAPPNKSALLVDFGAASTDIAISINKQLVFSRSIPIGGEAFTRSVAQGLGIDIAAAEEYKKAYGLSAGKLEGKVKTALDPVFRVVLEEFKKAIQYWVEQESGTPIQQLVLTGGTAGLREITPLITQNLGIETVIADPFGGISKNKAIADQLSGFAPLYSIAVGLAQREDV